MDESATKDRHRSALESALGPLAVYLADAGVGEVMVNPSGGVWTDTYAEGMVDTGLCLAAAERRRLLGLIAGQLGVVIDARRPVLEGLLPDWNYRLEGVLPPVAAGPCLAIRKPTLKIFPLAAYLTPPDAADGGEGEALPTRGFEPVLLWALAERKNILISGATSSAKTSFLNSLLQCLEKLGPASERIILLEDTAEIQCPMRNRVELCTTPGLDLATLVRIALRLRPDRIFIGEVRGPEALPMLKAWNTGHRGGAATVHANSARQSLYRLEELIAEGGSLPQRAMLARAVDLVVFLERSGPGERSVREIQHVLGLEGGDYRLQKVTRESA